MDNRKKAQTIDKDELTLSAVALDAIEYILQDVQDEFFDRYNPNDKDNQIGILYEFPRYRAKIAAISVLLYNIRKDFKKNNITAY